MYRDIYSEEQKDLMEHIKKNQHIATSFIDSKTITSIDDYFKQLHPNKKEVLKESINRRLKDMEMDLGIYISITLAIIAIQVVLVPIFCKYLSTVFKKDLTFIELLFALVSTVLIVIVNRYYFRRKRETLFYELLKNRINNRINKD